MKVEIAFLTVFGAGLMVPLIDAPAVAATTFARPHGRGAEAAPQRAMAAGRAKRRSRRKAGKAHAASMSMKSHAQASHKRRRSTVVLSTTVASLGTRDRGRKSAQQRQAVAPPERPSLIAKPLPASGLDDARHRQIAVAASAARSPVRSDRWESVLFLLNDVDPRAYPEACFWRALAEYRLGRLKRGDASRPSCRLSASDVLTLDAERKKAADLQGPPAQLAAPGANALNASGADEVPPVRNNLPYEGPAPTLAAAAP